MISYAFMPPIKPVDVVTDVVPSDTCVTVHAVVAVVVTLDVQPSVNCQGYCVVV